MMSEQEISNDLLLNLTEDIKLSRDESSERLRILAGRMKFHKENSDPATREVFNELYWSLQRIIKDTEHVKESFDDLYHECIRKPHAVNNLKPEGRQSVLENLTCMQSFSKSVALNIDMLETDIAMMIADREKTDGGVGDFRFT
jgi:hypothetical protein